MVHWRKWLRILHRDIGYIATGLTIIYSISGVAVNHVQDWNPNYVITKTTTKINPVPDSLVSSGNLVGFILKKIGETGKLKNSFYPDSTSVKIFVEGNTITANLKTGEVLQEKIKSRTVFRETNFLHLNAPKKVWTYVADIFAVALIFLALSGLCMIKGKKGITGRGAWLTALGILIP
ncbi:MAG: PepSY-associated TM helix domain-containing protein, partial [Ignavibacteria bacterium]|nr:PepSY-associated TM helix domain-containing protein [Ignavibacteria bacterium]